MPPSPPEPGPCSRARVPRRFPCPRRRRCLRRCRRQCPRPVLGPGWLDSQPAKWPAKAAYPAARPPERPPRARRPASSTSGGGSTGGGTGFGMAGAAAFGGEGRVIYAGRLPPPPPPAPIRKQDRVPGARVRRHRRSPCVSTRAEQGRMQHERDGQAGIPASGAREEQVGRLVQRGSVLVAHGVSRKDNGRSPRETPVAATKTRGSQSAPACSCHPVRPPGAALLLVRFLRGESDDLNSGARGRRPSPRPRPDRSDSAPALMNSSLAGRGSKIAWIWVSSWSLGTGWPLMA